MFNAKYHESTERLYNETSILNINQLYIFNICVFMYQLCHKLFPPVFENMFRNNFNVHDYNTRNQSLYALPYCRTEMRKRTIIYNGPYYNEITKA